MVDTRAQRSTSPTSPASVSTPSASAWLTPERVAHAEFRTGFRGLDTTEVRGFLARVASELRALLEREADLIGRLEAAEERNTAIVAAPLDIRQVSELLGQETARVLETARDAAADIKARAETDAAAMLEAATAEAERLRGEAAEVLGARTAEAEAAAEEIVAAARAEAERLSAEATEDAAAARKQAGEDAERLLAEGQQAKARAEADAAATREAARDEGRRMVAEARAVRERILTDMARRRNVARQQLERVRAARERLLDAIDGVRQNVADVQAELSGSLVEAKLAGERGARAVDVEDIPSMRDLDAEVEMAKDTGLIDVNALLARDEDLSVLDTGEFAAVTAPEPEVDRPTTADAHAAPADAEQPGRSAGDVAEVGDASAGAGDVVGVGEVAGAEAADAGASDGPEIIDVRDGGGDESMPSAGADGAAGATTDGPTGPAAGRGRAGKRGKAPKKADELFARLRADEDGPDTADAGRATGAAVVIGTGTVAVAAEPPEGAEPAPAAPTTATGTVEAGSEPVDAGTDAGAATDAANPDRVALHTRDALLAPTVRDLSRQLKLALSDQQNELLEAGRRAEGGEAASAPSVETMTGVYLAAAREELAAAFGLGRRSVRSDDKVAADPELVAGQAAALARAVVDALRQRLGAGSEDDGTGEMWPVEQVRSAYREVRSQRLAELVEFHVFSAYAAGQLAAAGDGALARWVCDSCGPDCLDNALAGPLPFGTAYPTGHVSPPSFAGCRCALVPVEEVG